jgi:putative DNA primase/helicase
VVDRHLTPTGDPLTELALAEDLVARHAAELRYVRPWRSWLHWDTHRWARDTTGVTERLLKDLVREKVVAAAALENDKQRRAALDQLLRFCTARQLQAALSLATTEPEVAVTPDVFDTDPWALNVLNGTINLRTGELLAHARASLITKLAPVAYDPAATCPRWERFLAEVFDGDRERSGFLQRGVGYSLTGSTEEQVLFFAHGGGQNGKTVAFETLHRALGPDYAQSTPFNTLLTQHHDGPRNDVARLRGARFVSASEAPGGRALDAAVLKQLVGSDTVVARFLHQEFFEFRPEFKLWLRANHKPPVPEQTTAFWRRMRLIPFDVKIPDAQRDNDLLDKLAGEAPGILAWAVRGCLAWQREGLGEPPAVRAATEAYRAENDVIGDFLAARCGLDANAWTATAELYVAFSGWWETTHAKHERPLTRAWFGRLLGEQDGLRPEQRGHAKVKGWRGVRLLEGAPSVSATTSPDADDANLPF